MIGNEGLNPPDFFSMENPRDLWNARAEIPGLRSVMSITGNESLCKDETKLMQLRILEELGDLKNKVVLEIGTGIGRFTGMLANHSNKLCL